jgi:hypothetical protein
MEKSEILEVIFKELLASPADGLTFEAIVSLPEFNTKPGDDEADQLMVDAVAQCLSELKEDDSIERWDVLDGALAGPDPQATIDAAELRYRLTFWKWMSLRDGTGDRPLEPPKGPRPRRYPKPRTRTSRRRPLA